jgi:magnesium chelatase subunit D
MDAPASDAALALALLLRDPLRFGGIILRGDGPARDAMLAKIAAVITPLVRIPANVDAERLLGGLDLTATLAAGTTVTRAGLLEAASGGAVIVPMAERLRSDVAAHLAQALDGGMLAAVLLDDGREGDEVPPAVLSERVAFHCDVGSIRLPLSVCPELVEGPSFLSAVERKDSPSTSSGRTGKGGRAVADVIPLDDSQLTTLAATASALGVTSIRALNFAANAARAHAALHGQVTADEDDITAAIRLVLAPRATMVPQAAPPPEVESEDATPPDGNPGDDDARDIDPSELDDIVLEAAAAAIPPHILDQIERRARGSGKAQSGRSGDKQKSAQRGRPLSARPGVPGHGRKLALIASLRAAAPWQTIRRQEAKLGDAKPGDRRRVHIRKDDLRVRAFEERRGTLTIFAVDASGSSAISRLAEAKGAVELMLAEAYVKRAQVALIAFRQVGAEVLLPPTRSLTRARRALAALPGGGGTPLAAGLIAAQQLASVAQRGGQTPVIALLTDGKANVRRDGSAGRAEAMAEAAAAAGALRQAGLTSVVIDIAPRPTPEAAALAVALGGRYVPLPRAGSAALVAAVESVSA